jgi:hypothetical protein
MPVVSSQNPLFEKPLLYTKLGMVSNWKALLLLIERLISSGDVIQ